MYFIPWNSDDFKPGIDLRERITHLPKRHTYWEYGEIHIYIYVGRELSTVGLLTLPTFGLLA